MQRLISFLTVGLLVLLSASELLAAPPTIQSSNIAFSAVQANSVRVILTPGNGDSRIVVFKAGNTAPDDPVNGSSYAGFTSNFSTTTQQTAAGSKVVYAGANRAVIVSGLTPGTEYTVEVYERNGTEYLIGGGSGNPRSFFTTPSQPASVGSGAHNTTHTAFRANWTNPSSGSWDGFIVTVSTENTFATALNWYNNAEVGSTNEITVQDVATTPAVDITPNTTYYYRVRTTQDGRTSNWVNGPFTGVTTLPLAPTLSEIAATICLGDTYIVTPTGPTPGNGLEEHKFKVWTAATGGTALNAFGALSVNITPVSPAITSYWVATVSNKTGLESATRTELVLSINEPGPIAAAGNDFSTCAATPYTYTMTGNNPAPAQGEWLQLSGPGLANFTDATLYNSTVTLPNNGVYVLQWTISQDGCNTTYDTVTVQISEPPTTASISPAPDVCGLLTATLTGNTPTSGTGTWTYTSLNGGTATFSPNANSPIASVTVSGPDEYTFIWTISTGSCSTSVAQDVMVFDAATTVANAGADDEVCGSLGYSFAGNAPTSSETGTWTLVSGAGNADFNGEENDPTAAVTVDAYGSYTFRWTIASEFGVCANTQDDVTIVFGQSISDAIAAAQQVTCGDLSVMLNATAPLVGNGEWSIVSGPAGATFDDPTLPDAFFEVIEYGQYTLRWTVSDPNGVCPDKTDDITIGFDELPTPANAGFDKDVCGLSTILSGNMPTIGTGTWSQNINDPGVATFSDDNMYNTMVSVNNYGTYSFEWEISNSCGTSADYVNVTFWNDMTSPALSAGSDFTMCNIGTVGQLNGSDPSTYAATASGVWTKVSGPGVPTFENGTANTDFDAEVSFNLIGTYVMRWTVTNGPCTQMDEITIEVTNAPTVTFGAIGPFCTSDAPITLTTGSPAGGVYSGAGVSGGVFTPANAGGAGTYTLTYTYDVGGCSGVATTVVTLTSPVAITWTENYGPVCEDASTFSIGDATPAGGVYSGNGVSGSDFDPSVAGAGSHTITYTYTDGNCTSTATKTIYVDAKPAIVWTENLGSVCQDETPFSLNASTSIGTGVYSGPGVSGDTFNPATAGVGTHTITYTATNGSCVTSETKSIIVEELPVIAWTNSYNPVCQDASAFSIAHATPIGGTYSGNGVIGDNFVPSVAGPGTHTITYSYTSGECTATETNTVIVYATPNVTWTTVLGSVCQDGGIVGLTGGSPAGGTYSGPGVSGTNFNPTTAGIGSHTLTYTYTDGNGCSAFATNMIEVVASPNVVFNAVAPVCAGSSAFSLTSYVSPAGGTFIGPGVSGSNFDPSSVGAGTYTIVYTVTVGSCTDFDTQVITVNAAPTLSWSAIFVPVCINASSFTLSGATPVGGTYSGPGVSGNSFNPASAGVGTHTLTYTYTDGNGCTNTITNTITVNALPTVTWTTVLSPMCTDGTPLVLSGGAPAGGTYSGPGVSSGSFNPAAAGAGTHTITYTYWDNNLCVNTVTNTIVVNALVIADAGDDANATAGELNYVLDGNVASSGIGTWTLISGPGTASFNGVNDNDAEVTVSAYGDYTFSWSIVNGSCTSYDLVEISFTESTGIATKFGVTLPGGPYISGQSFDITITTLDVNGNPAVADGPVYYETVILGMADYFPNDIIQGTIIPPATSTTITVTVKADSQTSGASGLQARVESCCLQSGFSPAFDLLPIAPAQAIDISLTVLGQNSIQFSVNKNGADGVVVVGRRGVLSVPSSIALTPGTTYSGGANSDFGSGTSLAYNTNVVYVGAANSSHTVTGLFSRNKYAFKAFAYYGSGSMINYNNVDTLEKANNRGTVTQKGAFDAEDLPLVGDNILSSSHITPNPARDNVSMTIDLTQSANVSISFFTADGKQVLVPVNGSNYNAGRHTLNIPLKGLAAGVYSVVISADNEVIIDNVVVMP